MSTPRNCLALVLTTIVSLAALSAEASAQSRPLRSGEEVRISWWDPSVPTYAVGAPRLMTAEVIDQNGDAIMLRRGNRVFTVPVTQMRTLQRRVGTRPASAPAMVLGSAAGFATGFAFGAMTGGLEGGSADVDRVQAGITSGVLIGAPVGALIAWLGSRSRGIYEDVPFGDVAAGFIADANGRVGLSVTVGSR